MRELIQSQSVFLKEGYQMFIEKGQVHIIPSDTDRELVELPYAFNDCSTEIEKKERG